MKQPDYAFTQGLVAERVAYVSPHGTDVPHEGGQPARRTTLATADELRQLSVEPYKDQERVAATIEELQRLRYIRSLGGVGFEAAIINSHVETGRVAFHFYGWGGNLRHPNAQREAIALQHHQPDVAHVFVNGPGIGNSSMLPRAAQREIRRTGSYVPLGDYLAPVAEHIAQDYDDIMVGGHSLGARTATGVAARMQPGMAQELRLHDPVGTRRMGLLRIGAGFALKEGMHGRRYTQAAAAPSAEAIGLTTLPVEEPQEIETAHTITLSPADEERPFTAPRHGWWQQFFVDPEGLRRDAFEYDLRLAAPNVERDITLFIPDMSYLNDWRAVRDIIGRLRSVDGRTADISQWNLLGHTHANMDQPASLATIYSAQV